jgi:SAM-dependent methyltransferase
MALAQIEWAKAYATWGVTTASIERAYSPARLLDVLRSFLPRQGKAVLELGYAPGRWLGWAAGALGVRPFGVELDSVGVKMSHALYPQIRGLRGDAFNLPIRDAVFDGVFAIGLLEHFEDPRPIVREAWRVLKGGGVSIWVVPNLLPGSLCRWHWSTFRPTNFAAHRAFTLGELSEAASSGGFSVVHAEFNGLYIPRLQRVLGRLPFRSVLKRLERPRLASNLVVVGVKGARR